MSEDPARFIVPRIQEVRRLDGEHGASIMIFRDAICVSFLEAAGGLDGTFGTACAIDGALCVPAIFGGVPTRSMLEPFLPAFAEMMKGWVLEISALNLLCIVVSGGRVHGSH